MNIRETTEQIVRASGGRKGGIIVQYSLNSLHRRNCTSPRSSSLFTLQMQRLVKFVCVFEDLASTFLNEKRKKERA
jgi:hypothetical protein